MAPDGIIIRGAREHTLKNIDLEIPLMLLILSARDVNLRRATVVPSRNRSGNVS